MRAQPRRSAFQCFAIAAITIVSFGCGGDKGPVEPPPPGDIQFVPPPGSYELSALDSLSLYVHEVGGSDVVAAFSVDGVEVGSVARFVFRGTHLGLSKVTARVVRGSETFEAIWKVTVTEEGTTVTPAVTSIVAMPGSVPGSLRLSWDAPAPSLVSVPLQDYLIAWSPNPIDEAGFAALPQIVVPHRADAIIQRAQLEGLDERQLYHVRIRTRDTIQRVSLLSQEGMSEATGHFDVTGSVVSVEPTRPVAGLANAVVEIAGVKTVTDLTGHFELMGLPDVEDVGLKVTEQNGATLYALMSPPLAPVDRQLDAVLFPRGEVSIDPAKPGIPTTMTTLDYFRAMTSNATQEPYLVVGWDRYPVRIYAQDYSFQSATELVDYRASFVRAVQAWNDVAADDLFELVDDSLSADVHYDLSVQGSNLGQAEIVEPTGGKLYETIPQKMVVHVIKNFNTQEVADRIIAHELGHVLGLTHSPSLNDLMAEVPQRSTNGRPTTMEAFAARLIRRMPQKQDVTWYVVPE